jgi:hypothetical protein
MWAVRAADDAVRRLAYEEGVRLYRAALALDATSVPQVDRCRTLLALGRAAYFAGDLEGCADAASAAADAARGADSPELLSEAALVLEAAPDPGVNAIAKQLCEEAITRVGDTAPDAMRARLLAQRSHLAFYDGEQDRVESLSAAALDLARQSDDDRALTDALHARKEARPGPAGRTERFQLASEMLALAPRTNSARTAMWGELWGIEALLENGELRSAADRLPALQVSVERVGVRSVGGISTVSPHASPRRRAATRKQPPPPVGDSSGCARSNPPRQPARTSRSCARSPDMSA